MRLSCRRLRFFVVTGRNRHFPSTEIGRFLAPNEHAAVRRARRLRPEWTAGLQLEARPA